jgi:hypothetical protein
MGQKTTRISSVRIIAFADEPRSLRVAADIIQNAFDRNASVGEIQRNIEGDFRVLIRVFLKDTRPSEEHGPCLGDLLRRGDSQQ